MQSQAKIWRLKGVKMLLQTYWVIHDLLNKTIVQNRSHHGIDHAVFKRRVVNVLFLPAFLITMASASPQSADDCEPLLLSSLSEISAEWLAQPDLGTEAHGELRGRTRAVDSSFFKEIEEIARAWQVEIQAQPFLYEADHLVFGLHVRGPRQSLISAFLDLQHQLGRLVWVKKSEEEFAIPEEGPRTPPQPSLHLPDFKPRRLTVTEWAVKGGAKTLYTGSSRLSDQKPLAFITYYGRPAWAVVLENWAKQTPILSEIEKLVDHRLIQGLSAELPVVLSREPGKLSELTGPKGFQSLSALSDEGRPALVTKGDVRLVVIPLLPFGPPTVEPASEESEPQDIASPSLIEDKQWRIGVEFATDVQWRQWVPDAEHFTQFFLRQLHWSLPIPGSASEYQLYYTPADSRPDTTVLVRFTFDQRSDEFAVITVKEFREFSADDQRDYWARTAIAHRFRGHTFRLGIQPITIGDTSHDRIRASAAVLARLEIRNQIAEDEVSRVLGFLNYATPQKPDLYRSEVQVERRNYRVTLSLDEKGHARLVSMQRL